MSEEKKNEFSKEFEERLSWDKESLEQLVMLDPETLEPIDKSKAKEKKDDQSAA